MCEGRSRSSPRPRLPAIADDPGRSISRPRTGAGSWGGVRGWPIVPACARISRPPAIRRAPHGAEGGGRRRCASSSGRPRGGGGLRGQPSGCRRGIDRSRHRARRASIDLARPPRDERGKRTPTDEPADERTNQDAPHRDLRPRAGLAVLQGTAGVAGHGDRAVAVPRLPGRRGGRGSGCSSDGHASVTSATSSRERRARGDPRDRGRPLREELRPLAGGARRSTSRS